jgi:hypothetical protein
MKDIERKGIAAMFPNEWRTKSLRVYVKVQKHVESGGGHKE